MLMHKGYGQKCDIWMIGMLIYEMIHNTTPFKGDTPTELFKSILSDKPKFSKKIDPNIYNLLKKLLIKDPVRRPSIYEVIDHKWFDAEIKKQIDRFQWRPKFIPILSDLGDCRYYDAFDNNLLDRVKCIRTIHRPWFHERTDGRTDGPTNGRRAIL